MEECPAEIVVEKLKYGRWSWAVCQPDAHWGEWSCGFADSQIEAYTKGLQALSRVHAQQGY
jgi:hypothetical protein